MDSVNKEAMLNYANSLKTRMHVIGILSNDLLQLSDIDNCIEYLNSLKPLVMSIEFSDVVAP
jgi:hypothetical protein